MAHLTGLMARTLGEPRSATRSPSDSAARDRFNADEFANIAKHEADFWWYRGMRSIQMALLDPLLRRPVASALEAGCGTGYFARSLQRERGVPLAALDYSAVGLRYGTRQGLQRAAQGSLLELPFPTGAFDLAMSFDVLQQFAPGE